MNQSSHTTNNTPMDPNPKNFPILSYVMTRLPTMKHPNMHEGDIETATPRSATFVTPKTSFNPAPNFELTERMPHLSDPQLMASMRSAVADVSQTRSLLKTLGDRPDHEAVDAAKARLAEIESKFSNDLDEIKLSDKVDPEEEKQKKAIERERQMHKTLISLDQMHKSYDKMLSEAEKKLEKLYESVNAGKQSLQDIDEGSSGVTEEVKEEVVAILSDAMSNGAERIDLSERRLPFLPEAFGKIRTLVYLNLSSNQLEVSLRLNSSSHILISPMYSLIQSSFIQSSSDLNFIVNTRITICLTNQLIIINRVDGLEQVIPDSVAGLENLEELNVSGNMLSELPESIGCLHKLKILDVSSNKLDSLPDSICYCRSLEEIDASFNKLTYLPTKMGYELVNLRKLAIALNKVRNFPTSIGDMKSLQYLDAHFNELRGLPDSIGKLSNLEVLNLGSNFSDLQELPETIGDLTSLRELDVSNNQLSELPLTFGRLDKLTKFNVDQNPLVIPPQEVVQEGIAAVKVYMAQRWFDVLVEEEEKTRREAEALAQASWVSRSKMWLTGAVAGAAVYLGAGESEDPYLEEER
ncbi:hypothetical protein LXL04_030746 [Taraxacum kok-saghyz]